MKRIIATVGATAMMVASAVPAAAYFFPSFGGTDTLNNVANINTTMSVSSNTGSNLQKNFGSTGGSHWGWGGSNLTQGNVGLTGAATAIGVVETQANNNTGCNCFDDVNNTANVYTVVGISANTGGNSQYNFGYADKGTLTQGNMLGTGAAAAQGTVFTVVNSNFEME